MVSVNAEAMDRETAQNLSFGALKEKGLRDLAMRGCFNESYATPDGFNARSQRRTLKIIHQRADRRNRPDKGQGSGNGFG